MNTKSLSLRTRMMLSMIFLIIFVTIAALASLAFSRVFELLDSYAFRQFREVTANASDSFNLQVGDFVKNISSESEKITEKTKKLNWQNQNEVSIALTENLFNILENNHLSGTFFIIDEKQITGSDSLKTVYIKNEYTGSQIGYKSNLVLQIGTMDISTTYSIPTTISWDLQIGDRNEIIKKDFYKNPIEAAKSEPYKKIQHYGYWSSPFSIGENNQEILTYTVPIMDDYGRPIGILGAEFRPDFLMNMYFPNLNLSFKNGFFIISQIEDDKVLNNEWLVSNSPLAYVHLPNGENLNFKKSILGSYTTYFPKLGKMYSMVSPLKIYGDNSPFSDTKWSLIGFVPETSIRESSKDVINSLGLTLLPTTIIAIVAVIVLSYFSTRKISGLSYYLNNLNPNEDIKFRPTGMSEIDELTNAIESLNNSVKESSRTTSKILELSLLPIGGVEINRKLGVINTTNYINELLGIPLGEKVSYDALENGYDTLTANPTSEKDVYRYISGEGHPQWFRISVQETETGLFGVIVDVTEEMLEREKLKMKIKYDSMTGLLNRNSFIKYATRQIDKNPEDIGALVFSDLDNLKYTNDSFGHDVGDSLIKGASRIFEKFSDYGAVVSRISGDEFAVYIHGFKTEREALEIIGTTLESKKNNFIILPSGEEFPIRFSTGISWYPKDSKSIRDLIKFADFAMYEAKSTYKGSIKEFDRRTYDKNIYISENSEVINHLLDEERIYFSFQPIISMKTGEIVAYEALMRTDMENFKSPVEIFTVAKSQSKLKPLEILVFKKIFQTLHEKESQFKNKKIFVNSIPSHMIKFDEILDLSDKYPFNLQNLVIEVTESEQEIFETMTDNIRNIRGLGIKIALDDFGKGYSSEMRILEVDPDIIKVDMELIRDIHLRSDKEKLLSNLISYCKPRNIQVLAEGVEKIEELEKIHEKGVDLVQGFLIGMPDTDFKGLSKQAKEHLYKVIGNRFFL